MFRFKLGQGIIDSGAKVEKWWRFERPLTMFSGKIQVEIYLGTLMEHSDHELLQNVEIDGNPRANSIVHDTRVARPSLR